MLKKLRGFTLIELLIVVAIIGILAALLIPNALTAMQKAKQKGTMKDITTISTALADYVTDNGRCPNFSEGDVTTTFTGYISPFYIKVCPLRDQWGTLFRAGCGQANATYRGCALTGVDDFVVYSYGRDGVTDSIDFVAANPEAGMFVVNEMGDFNADLIMFNGNWVRAPTTRQ